MKRFYQIITASVVFVLLSVVFLQIVPLPLGMVYPQLWDAENISITQHSAEGARTVDLSGEDAEALLTLLEGERVYWRGFRRTGCPISGMIYRLYAEGAADFFLTPECWLYGKGMRLRCSVQTAEALSACFSDTYQTVEKFKNS